MTTLIFSNMPHDLRQPALIFAGEIDNQLNTVMLCTNLK